MSSFEIVAPSEPAEPSKTPLSEQLTAEMASADHWRAIMQEMESIAEELSLPQFGDFMADEITPDMIRVATGEQIESAETRVAMTKSKSGNGKVSYWANREKTALPIWFHLPQGKGVVRRLMASARFTQKEIAGMLGLRLQQFEDYIKGLGLREEASKMEMTRKIRRYKELTSELASYGRMMAARVSVKMLETVLEQIEDQTMKPLDVSSKMIGELNKILVANDPTESAGANVGTMTPSLNVGVRVTHVNREHKTDHPPDMEIETEVIR